MTFLKKTSSNIKTNRVVYTIEFGDNIKINTTIKSNVADPDFSSLAVFAFLYAVVRISSEMGVSDEEISQLLNAEMVSDLKTFGGGVPMTFLKRLTAHLKARKEWREMQAIHKQQLDRKVARHEHRSALDKEHMKRVTAILRGEG